MFRNMTRYFTTIIFLITAFGFGQAAIAQTCTPAPVNLVSWWSADGNALDSRSRNNGTLVANAGFAAGKVGQAFNLDGLDDAVQIPHNSNQNIQGSFSAEVWIFPRSLPNAGPRILDKDDQAGNRWLMAINNTASFVNSLSVAIGTAGVTTPNNSIPLGQWTHVAFTYDVASGDFLAFINGVQAASVTVASLTTSGLAPLIIGNDSFPNPPGDPNARDFDGLIDEPAIYNRALSASEIQAIFNAGTSGKCKPTATVAPANMVSSWAGDGDYRDNQGINNGTPTGGTQGFAIGKVGQAFNFMGGSALVQVAPSPSHNLLSAVTIEAWIKPVDPNRVQLIAGRAGGPGNSGGYQIALLGNGRVRFAIHTGPPNGGAFHNVDSTSPIPANVFTHVAGTYDQATGLNIYVNGVSVPELPIDPITGPMSDDPNSNFEIGEFSTFPGVNFVGQIDEVSLYSRALSQSEIQSIFNAGIAGKLKTATTATGSNVSTNAGSDATLVFANVSATGTTQQIPLDTAVLPPLPAGFTHTGLAYDIATAAVVSGNINITFHLPSFNTQSQFSFLKVLHREGSTFVDRTVVQDFAARTLTATVSSLSPFVIAQGSTPTAIKLASFTATGFDDGRVLLRWQTGFEADNLGFNLYREVAGKRTLINASLVAGSALIAGARTVLSAGQSYIWADTLSRNPNARYWLESVDLNGKRTWHGPFAVRTANGKSPSLAESELLARIGWRQSLAANGLGSTPVQRTASIPRLAPELLASQSALADKPAAKLAIRREGWYRITQSELAAIGFDTRIDPRLLQLFVDGRELPILVAGEQDGSFDPSDAVEFYGLPLDSPYSDARVYWLVAGTQPGLRVPQIKRGAGPSFVQSFTQTVERRDRSIYFPALRNGERENFFGAVITQSPLEQTLTLSHLAPAKSPDAVLEVALQGVTLTAHRVRVELNSTAVGEVVFDGQAQGIARFNIPPSSLREGQNTLSLTANGGPGDVSLIDAIRIAYPHSYTADNNVLKFTAPANQPITINGFSSAAIRVIDVTTADAPQEVLGTINKQADGYAITLAAPAGGERTLLAFTSAPSPASASMHQPANLRNGNADYLILTQRELADSLRPLAALRQRQGLSVTVADIEDIYDEFSFGQKTPYAVRAFLSFAISNWKKKPRYVVLAADASYDPKNYLGLGDADLVPTKLVDTELMETASDDWFSDFNGDGIADIATGRLPARTADEANQMVSKLISYESASPAQEALLVADRNDGFNFESASDELLPLLPAGLRVTQVNRGRVGDEIARTTLLDALSREQRIVNYVGHGSVDLWSGHLLTASDAQELKNNRHLPLFVMMTCLNGYFHDAALDSLAEALMKTESGGALAVWASSGMTLPTGQAAMNRELYRLLFNQAQTMTMGEAVMRAKAAASDIDIRRTWLLFGDPAMKLR